MQPYNIAIEILESVIHDELDSQFAKSIKRLQELGFSIELDDFGTGYASLEKLLAFSVNRIKIDRQFLVGAVQNPDKQALLATIIGIGATLSIEVLVEGAEDQDDYRLLEKLGCNVVQGHVIAMAQSVEDTERWIAEWHAGLDAKAG